MLLYTTDLANIQFVVLDATTYYLPFQEDTVSRAWLEVTLSLQEDLLHLHYPREERRKGFVFMFTLQ